MDSKETGRFICALRKSKGLTQLALAELLGVSNRTVSKWETGEGMPDISLLPELAAALGKTPRTVQRTLQGLLDNGLVVATAPRTSRDRKYLLSHALTSGRKA